MKTFILLLCFCTSLSAFSQSLEEDNRVPNQYMVMLHRPYSAADLKREFPGLIENKCLSKRMNIWLMERNNSTGAEAFLDSLRSSHMVKIAQFNHRVKSRSIVPDDQFLNLQWNMLNVGQSGGTPGADIDAIDAWGVNHGNITVGGDTIVVAMIDEGFDSAHQDLNFFINHHEIPGNGIDDDGNGYIDDYNGWNVFDTSDNVTLTPADHSMHISGIAAAIGNDSIGVAGVCWGAQVLRVCGSSGDESQVVAAYDYCIVMRDLYNNTSGEKGAFIVSTNSSFGVDYANPADYPLWCAMYDSMGAVGILSAGATADEKNDDVDVKYDMPTACPSKWLITVTNTDRNDQLNLGAAYGQNTIALGAPGTTIYSTELDNSYGYLTGTSMSAPLVAGAVAAMFAAACPKLIDDYHAYPDSIALIVKQMMLDGTTQLPTLYHRTITGGRLNLFRAIENLKEYNCNSCKFFISDSSSKPSCSNSCNGTIQLVGTGSTNFTYTEQNLCPGYYPITLTDSSGCSETRNIYFPRPDSLVISSIQITAGANMGQSNIIIGASEGNYLLEYSIDGINYQPTPVFTVNSNGTYTVYIENENGCVVATQVVVSGLSEISAINDWSIYPNPASDLLNVSLNLSKSTDVKLSVTDVLGATVFEQPKSISAGYSSTSIPLSTLAPGAYFLRLEADGSVSSKKFVIVK